MAIFNSYVSLPEGKLTPPSVTVTSYTFDLTALSATVQGKGRPKFRSGSIVPLLFHFVSLRKPGAVASISPYILANLASAQRAI